MREEQERLTAYTEVYEREDTYYCLRCRVRYKAYRGNACPVCERMAVINLSGDEGVPRTRSYRREKQYKLLSEKDGQLSDS